MIFVESPIAGAFVLDVERREDERGFFARSFCRAEFQRHGLNAELTQCNISFNKRCGTLRGMHYQIEPHPEAKLVRRTMGAIFDAVIDLRPGSASRKRWFATELTADNRRMLFVPEGCAHGFVTLTDNTEVFYQMSADYHPECARTVAWDDPEIGIQWPLEPIYISDSDRMSS